MLCKYRSICYLRWQLKQKHTCILKAYISYVKVITADLLRACRLFDCIVSSTVKGSQLDVFRP